MEPTIPDADLCSKAMSVSDVVGIIGHIIDFDERLQGIWVCGEISNFNLHRASGHMYFSIKDRNAALRAVFFRNSNSSLNFMPEDGMEVLIFGRVGVYGKTGAVQFYVDYMQQKGVGSLYIAYQELVVRLRAEGLFDKPAKPLPRFPRRIGIITSESAAALQDALNVLNRRYPCVEVALAPAAVQGRSAPVELMAALKRLDAVEDLDLILMIRGGGSIEDLWAFNDESLARAVAAARHPIVTGVGHEVDFTIADFAADYRAPTPSAAAETAVPDRLEVLAELDALAARLRRALAGLLQNRRLQLGSLLRSQFLRVPMAGILARRQALDELVDRLPAAHGRLLRERSARLTGLEQRLRALSPSAVLERGYALCADPDTGLPVTRASELGAGDRLEVRFADGRAHARVENLVPDSEGVVAHEPPEEEG